MYSSRATVKAVIVNFDLVTVSQEKAYMETVAAFENPLCL